MTKRIGAAFAVLLLTTACSAWEQGELPTDKRQPEFVLVYVPLEWDAGMAEFQRMCQQHTRWFLAMSGIEEYADVRVEYVGEVMRHTNLKSRNLDNLVARFGAKRVIGDVYVGLTLRDVGEAQVAGWTEFYGRGIVGEIDRPFLVAHELGHTFGLCDEYRFEDWSIQNRILKDGCPNPYPDNCDTDASSRYYCTGTAVGSGYCIMGNSPREETYCAYCQGHLWSEFEQRFERLVPSPTVTRSLLGTRTPTPTVMGSPTPIAPEPTPTGRATLPPPPATPTWPAEPTLPPGVPSDTPRPPATSMPLATPVPSAYNLMFISEQNGLFHVYRLDESERSLVRLHTSSEPIRQPASSPDGRQIAFVLAGADDWDVYVLDADTGEVGQVTHGPSVERDPGWLPDGTLTFVSDLEHGYGIYEASTTDQPPRLLLPLASDEYDPAFSPDGGEVAVVADTPQGYAVRIYSANNGTVRQLATGAGAASSVSWSADGSQLLYTVFGDSHAKLQAVSRDGMQIELPALRANAAYGIWTPRVGEVLFSSDADGDWEIYVMRLEDGDTHALTRNTVPDLYPMVSR